MSFEYTWACGPTIDMKICVTLAFDRCQADIGAKKDGLDTPNVLTVRIEDLDDNREDGRQRQLRSDGQSSVSPYNRA